MKKFQKQLLKKIIAASLILTWLIGLNSCARKDGCDGKITLQNSKIKMEARR